MDITKQNIKKILIINTFGIGDVLFTTPLISNLKAAMPGVMIGYVGNNRTKPILSVNPKISKVYSYERDDFNYQYRQSKVRFFRLVRDFVREIKKERYDLALDLSLNTYPGFFCRWAGIPRRIGYDYKKRGVFLTQKINLKGYEDKHVAEYYLDLLRAMGIEAQARPLDLFVPDPDTEWAEKQFVRFYIDNPEDFVVALFPGGGASWGKSADFKRWGGIKYAKLADKMIEKFSAKIILIGDHQDSNLCDEVIARMEGRPSAVFVDQSITQIAAFVKKCHLAIVNDGGPLHMAVAMGTRTVSLFGPVDERVYGPYPKADHVTVTKGLPCQPCYRRFRMAQCGHLSCLRNLSVDEVFEKIKISLSPR